MQEASQLQVKHSHLGPEDFLFLYTDGLIENCGPESETLNSKRISKLLNETAGRTAQGILERLIAEGRLFWKNHPADDDVTVLVIKKAA